MFLDVVILSAPGESSIRLSPGYTAPMAKSAGGYALSVDVTIAAAPAAVWTALTTGIGEWWPKHFFSGDGAKKFVCEAKVGGRLFEDWGKKAGAMWGSVAVYQPPSKMVWALHMYPGFGGPGTSYVTLTLTSNKGTTTVTLHDTGLCLDIGRVAESLKSGWAEWLAMLKAHCET
jgi:uncharacterized protein YndB with AHSA1/START domain